MPESVGSLLTCTHAPTDGDCTLGKSLYINDVLTVMLCLQEGVGTVVLTLGPLGVALCTLGAGGLHVVHMPVSVHLSTDALL